MVEADNVVVVVDEDVVETGKMLVHRFDVAVVVVLNNVVTMDAVSLVAAVVVDVVVADGVAFVIQLQL